MSDWYGTSRALAAILMESNKCCGKRSEMAMVCFVINGALLFMHISGRNNPNELPCLSLGEGNVLMIYTMGGCIKKGSAMFDRAKDPLKEYLANRADSETQQPKLRIAAVSILRF